MIRLATVKLQWSTSEQEYPFEGDSSGNTLYCKEIDCGPLPDTGQKFVAHGIPGLDVADIFKWEVFSTSDGIHSIADQYAEDGAPRVMTYLNSTNIVLITNSDRSTSSVSKCRIIYKK